MNHICYYFANSPDCVVCEKPIHSCLFSYTKPGCIDKRRTIEHFLFWLNAHIKLELSPKVGEDLISRYMERDDE